MTPAQETLAAPEAASTPGAERRFAKALIFTPHPDDAELSGGATMAKWASEGTEVVLCVVTIAAMGSNDPSVARDDLIATREAEQRAAAGMLGVSEVIFLGEAFLAAVNPGSTTVPLYRAELYDKGFEPHQVKAALLSLTTNGDFTVDAEGFMDVKLAALRAHDSQLGAWEGLEGFVVGMAETIATASGTGLRQAESFKAFFFD